jgi:hypothetical protein
VVWFFFFVGGATPQTPARPPDDDQINGGLRTLVRLKSIKTEVNWQTPAEFPQRP